MKPFHYERATDAASAVALVAGAPDAAFLAGGTNLVDLMKLGVATPELLVDVSGLPLGSVDHHDDGTIVVGAAVRNSDLAADPLVRERHPVLAQALLAGASGQLRNVATVGGNLLQRTRCPYFQDVTKPCNKRRPGTGCPARDGEHRNLAILGASDACIATHPSDMAVALAALDAVVLVETPHGPRRVPVTELYRSPGTDPSRDTVLDHGSLVTGIELPPPPAGRRAAYRKVRDRASFAFAVLSLAAVVQVDDGVVTDVRLALGAVAPGPWRARRAEELLIGEPPGEDRFRLAAEAELAAAAPLRDNAFKVTLARNIITRVLTDLTAAAGAAGAA